MHRALTLLTALTSLATQATAKQCAAFDNSGNLYLFGGSEDVNIGQSGSWGRESFIIEVSSSSRIDIM